MRIAIVGCGAVGGYLAGRAVEAGHEVIVVGRGRTAAVVAKDGLGLSDSAGGERSVHACCVVDETSSVGVVELILLCVKAWQVREVLTQLAPLVGPCTRVVTVQNGLEASQLVAQRFGALHVMPGALMMVVEQARPGHFKRLGGYADLEVGPLVEPSEAGAARINEEVVSVLRSLGLRVSVSHDIQRSLWRKLVFAAAVSGVPALWGVSASAARRLSHVDLAVRAAIGEGVEVARSVGVSFTGREVQRLLYDYQGLPDGMMSSMQRDILLGGPSELLWQNGEIVRRGLLNSIETPVHQRVLDKLLKLEGSQVTVASVLQERAIEESAW
ncbi:2-dehydropantoate 2-reductase [Mycobacteroides abscessus]|uniref:ketopantoate reductase family protein n=1 Tax=Mycobacteroides abscessus TaxID=36809 RepID=UPI0009A94529